MAGDIDNVKALQLDLRLTLSKSERFYVWRGSIVSRKIGGGFFEEVEITCHSDRRTLSWLYPVEVNYVSSCVAVVNQPIRIGIDQGYLPFIWGGRKFWLESSMVHAITFGKLQKLWAVVWGDAIFLLFLVCSVNLDIFEAGRIPTTPNCIVLCFCTRVPPGWFYLNGNVPEFFSYIDAVIKKLFFKARQKLFELKWVTCKDDKINL